LAANLTDALRPISLILLIVCYARRNEAIGGWLMVFYYQIYGTLAVFALEAIRHSEAYRPSYWDTELDYIVFLCTILPKVVGFVLVASVATVLLRKREWFWVRNLKFVLLIAMLLVLFCLALDALFFQAALVSNFVRLVILGAWLAYFMVSERVQRVFPQRRSLRGYPPPSAAGPFR
jgi:hypothetical protein